MRIPLFRKDGLLIARIQSGASYQDRRKMEWELEIRSRQFGSRAVLLDVTELEIVGSVAVRSLQDIAVAEMRKVYGSQAVIAGIEYVGTMAIIRFGTTPREAGEKLHVEGALQYLAGISRQLSDTQNPDTALGFRAGFGRKSCCGPGMLNIWLTFGPHGASMLGRWRWPIGRWFGCCQWQILVGKRNCGGFKAGPYGGLPAEVAVV